MIFRENQRMMYRQNMMMTGQMMDEHSWNENENLKFMNHSVLSHYVHYRWGSQDVDPRSSLTVLRDFSDKKENKKEAKISGARPHTSKDNSQRTVTTIMEMDIDAIGAKLLEREKARKSLYRSKASRKVEPGNQKQYSADKLLTCYEA